MKAINAWKQALLASKGRFGDLVTGSLISIALRLLAACPLMAFLASDGGFMKYVALLTPLAIIFVIWPLRYSEAEALADFMAGGKLTTAKLVSFDNYAEKLKKAVINALLVLLWALPLLAALGYLYFTFMGGGDVDAFTALRFLGEVGGLVGGTFFEGIIVIFVCLVLLALPMCYGLCRLSGCRHLWAVKAPMNSMDGARLPQLLLGVINAAVLLPLFGAFIWMGLDIVKVFLDTFSLPSMTTYLYLAVAAVAVLYLPLVPLRKLSVACFSQAQAKNTHAA